MDRSLQGLRRNWLRVLLAAALCVVCVAYLIDATSQAPTRHAVSVTPPEQYFAPLWQRILGSDKALNSAMLAELGNLANSDLTAPDARAVSVLADRLAIAQLSGAGRASFGTYFAGAAPPLCTAVHIEATSPAQLPVTRAAPGSVVTRYSKVAIVYRASCPSPANTDRVLYLYFAHTTAWAPVHDFSVPGFLAISTQNPSPTPPDWALHSFSTCGASSNATYRDLIVVVDAFEIMCADAQRAGVSLVLSSALRTPSEQAALFAQAVATYGSVSAATRWVAYATATTCSSRHCAGTALDIADTDTPALDWLHQIVGCISGVTVVLNQSSCPSGSLSLSRMQRYGFVNPDPQIPSYLDFVLPTYGSIQNSCSPPSSLSVPQIIASVFRCRLEAAGIDPTTTATEVASALVVSRCESSWNPAALAFGGRWLTTPDPATNRTYDNAGVFMLSSTQARTYVPGGPAARTSTSASANGAASLWLTTRSWAAFGCATGHGAFDAGPVLPQYGGPPLPAWSLAF
jgi:hypothetical protein